jgi:hypothetical protein
VGRHREEKGTGKENETELKEKFLHKTFPQVSSQTNISPGVRKAHKQTFPQVRKALKQTFPRYGKLSNIHFLSFSAENSLVTISSDIPNKHFFKSKENFSTIFSPGTETFKQIFCGKFTLKTFPQMWKIYPTNIFSDSKHVLMYLNFTPKTPQQSFSERTRKLAWYFT